MSVKIQKSIVCTKKFIFGILEHVAAEIINIQDVLLMIQ